MIEGLRTRTDETWYRPTGEPVYDANIRTARKDGLLPRVTSILKLWPKPELESWKQEQLVLAAITLPRQPGEADDQFAARVVADAQAQTKATAEWGSDFHGLIERAMGGEDLKAIPPKFAPFFEKWLSWFKSQIHKVIGLETVVVSQAWGYGGRMDHLFQVNGEVVIADTKTRGVKGGKPAWYDEQPMQLSAYARCLPSGSLPAPTKYLSIVINRDTPESPYVRWWTPEEIEEGWQRFQACFTLWKTWKRYKVS